MGILTRAGDLVYTFRFLKLLVTPFDKTDAFEMGIVDSDGKRDKSVKLDTSEKKSAYTPFHRLVFNIKRIMGKAPGGSSRLASYAAALFLIKEQYGVDVDKAMKEMQVNKYSIQEEMTEWFVIENNVLAPGVYRVKNPKVINTTFEELVQKRDQVRVLEDATPVGEIAGVFVYEAIHMKTNQPVYVTTGELIR